MVTVISVQPSKCHDNPDAVDATIVIDGVWGDVTLLPGPDGRLEAWGHLEMWAEASLHAAIEAGAEADIVAAVRAAVS
jgi:hypothetical protein